MKTCYFSLLYIHLSLRHASYLTPTRQLAPQSGLYARSLPGVQFRAIWRRCSRIDYPTPGNLRPYFSNAVYGGGDAETFLFASPITSVQLHVSFMHFSRGRSVYISSHLGKKHGSTCPPNAISYQVSKPFFRVLLDQLKHALHLISLAQSE